MPIPGIGGVPPVAGTGYLAQPQATKETPELDFGSSLGGAIDGLQELQSTSNQLALEAVTGDLTDVHRATLASTRAQITLELVAAVRNKGVSAFNEIMRMQA